MSVKIRRRPAVSSAVAPTPSMLSPAQEGVSEATHADRWRAAVAEVEKASPLAAPALKQAALLGIEKGVVSVQLPPGLMAATAERRRPEIEAVFARFFGRPTRLEVKRDAVPPGATEPTPASAANSVTPTLGASLARARQVGAKLASATDKLNASLSAIESELAAMGLGVTASVVMQKISYDDRPWSFLKCLGFGKLNREWKLFYECGDDDGDEWDSTPLLNASREIRLMAVDHLPALIDELVKTAEGEIAGVAAKATELEKLAAAVRNGGSK